MIGSVEEFARLCESTDENDFLRAISDQAPTFVWEEIVRRRPELAEVVVNSATVPDSVIETIAMQGIWRARYEVAAGRRAPAHLLAHLAKDEDVRVRRALLSNPNTPLKTLGQLREDTDPETSEAAKIIWEERAARRGGRHSSQAEPVWEASLPPSEPLPADSEVGLYQSYFDRLCAEYRLSSTDVVRSYDPRDPGLPPPPSGPWVVSPWGGDIHAVGVMRGAEFTVYAFVPDLREAVDLVARLVHAPIPTRRAPADLEERGQRTGQGITQRTLARQGRPGPNELAPGDMLDGFDDVKTHFLYALGTSIASRGQDAAVLNNPYHAYEVLAPIPMAVIEGLVAPPRGGGAIVVFDRPVRWYLDNGYLAEVV